MPPTRIKIQSSEWCFELLGGATRILSTAIWVASYTLSTKLLRGQNPFSQEKTEENRLRASFIIMRLPYLPDPPPAETSEDAAIIERTQDRRDSRKLLSIDRTLLYSPAMTDGWNVFFGAIRKKSNLKPLVREVAICRIAALTGAWYEWSHHAPLAEAGGLDAAALQFIHDAVPVDDKVHSSILSPELWLVFEYTDDMTKKISVGDILFEKLKKNFSNSEIVELTLVIAAYNCVSRFLIALDVGEMNSSAGIKFASPVRL